MPRILPVVPLMLSIAALLVAGVVSAADLPRAPGPGLSYLERMFLPEPLPEEGSLSTSAPSPSDPFFPESSPGASLAGTSFTWTSMSPPDGRSNHTAVYDPVQDRVLVFGGRRLDQSLGLEVCSVAGRIVRREPPITGFAGGHAEFQIPGLEALPAGMYFVRVRVGAEVVSSRLVKLQ